MSVTIFPGNNFTPQQVLAEALQSVDEAEHIAIVTLNKEKQYTYSHSKMPPSVLAAFGVLLTDLALCEIKNPEPPNA